MRPLFGGPLPFGIYYHERVGTITARTREKSKNDALFADDIWPGSILMANTIADTPLYCENRCVLELGAGAALPSLVCGKLNPKILVISDFPDETILESIELSLEENSIHKGHDEGIVVIGHKWGESVEDLLEPLRRAFHNTDLCCYPERFDLVLLSELLWKDTYRSHFALLKSLKACLKPDGEALVSLAHRPTDDFEHSRERDMEFFSLAQTAEFGFQVDLLRTEKGVSDALAGSGEANMDVYLYVLKFSANQKK